MIEQVARSNQKSVRPQQSDDNPGWNGPGVPSFRNLTLDRSRLAARSLFETNLSVTLNLVRATTADLWNFHVWRPLSKKVKCPCCGWTGPAFMQPGTGERLHFKPNALSAIQDHAIAD